MDLVNFLKNLMPKMIYNILNNKPLPIYAKGKNSREWIYVDDHCEALLKLFLKVKMVKVIILDQV